MARGEAFHFGDCTLDVAERQLLRSATVVRLSPKAFDVLVALVRHPGHKVTKDELLADVWPESFVEEGIPHGEHVSALRKALGDDQRPPTYIETVARSGYRFIAPVTRVAADDEPPAPSVSPRPVELYEFVGRGRTHLLSGSYFELPNAVDAFRAAVEIDSTYAPAHAGLARARCAQAALRAVPHQEAFAEAKASALRALAMDSTSADAQVAPAPPRFSASGTGRLRNAACAARSTSTPITRKPCSRTGSLQEALGRLDDGLRIKQQALARDPRSALVLVQIAMSYWHQRKYDDTLVWAQRALDVDPKHLLASEFLAGVYWKVEDIDKFVAENLRLAVTFGVPDEALANLKQVTVQIQDAYAAAGLAGMTRFMAEQITLSAWTSTTC